MRFPLSDSRERGYLAQTAIAVGLQRAGLESIVLIEDQLGRSFS